METKVRPITKSMKTAASLLLKKECVPSHNQKFYFAGRYEAACHELVELGLCIRHPKGLMIYSQTNSTLTREGSTIGRQCYSLTKGGVRFAKGLNNG